MEKLQEKATQGVEAVKDVFTSSSHNPAAEGLPLEKASIEKRSTGSKPGSERSAALEEVDRSAPQVALVLDGSKVEDREAPGAHPAVARPGEGLPLQEASIEKPSTGSKPGGEESAHLEEVSRGSPQVALVVDSSGAEQEPSPVVVKPREEGAEALATPSIEEASVEKPSTGSLPGREASAQLGQVDRSPPQVALVLDSARGTSEEEGVVVKPGEEAPPLPLEEASIEKPSTGSKPGVSKPACIEEVDRSSPKVALVVEGDPKQPETAVVTKPGEEAPKDAKSIAGQGGFQNRTDQACKAGA